MDGLDRAKKEIHLAPTLDETGREVIPRRSVPYDTLVLCLGQHDQRLRYARARPSTRYRSTTPQQAALFHSRLLNACLRANAQQGRCSRASFTIAIIGAGATGVELAAELHNTIREFVSFGLDRINPERDIKITVVEAAPKILPALPDRLSRAVWKCCSKLEVEVLTGERVTEVSEQGVKTATGREIPAELVVWAAGIKAPDFLQGPRRARDQPHQPAGGDARRCRPREIPNIFAFGDCAGLPLAREERLGAAARAVGAPAGFAPVPDAAATPGGQAARSRSCIATSARWSHWASSAPSAA